MESNRIQIRTIRQQKRFRSAFTTEQVHYLEQQFQKFPYISSEHRKEIAEALSMQERAIKIWFQNRRMKEKKDTNNKETNDETNQAEEFGSRLINVCPLPSTNGQQLYSLPIISKLSVDSTTLSKTNTDSVHSDGQGQGNNKLLHHNLTTNHSKMSLTNEPITPVFLKQQVQLPMKKNTPCYKSAERKAENLIDLCQKEKKVSNNLLKHNVKQEVIKKIEAGKSICGGKARTAPVDMSSNIKKYILQGSQTHRKPQKKPFKLAKQAELNGPTHIPMISTIYAHPLISSGGMIWKPVNVMPVISTSAVSGPRQSHENFGHVQKGNCICNCHGNIYPISVHPGPINPYTHYMVTEPFQKTSPNL